MLELFGLVMIEQSRAPIETSCTFQVWVGATPYVHRVRTPSIMFAEANDFGLRNHDPGVVFANTRCLGYCVCRIRSVFAEA